VPLVAIFHGHDFCTSTFFFTDETNKVSFIANLNVDKSGNTSKVVEKIKIFFYQAFLPQGFPDTVSNDYIEYQLWDTAQVCIVLV
jgi:Protein of unknown function, DUF647.